ncbi:MAG: alpha/beta hydrolase [Chloroflexi bacterium]|nr:alpha/beta hydrolase [Chloroflexota bacterium]MDA1227133.1 alpha/beta hydrolase [Chloroflexota bacterium]
MPYVRSGNAEIYYEVHGEGPPITFSHGAGGNTLVWYNQVPYFAKDHTVLTFDHRGWGRSQCKREDKHAKFFADDLKAVLDDAGIERTALVCQSMGGWTGMHFTLDNPGRVSCIVLSGTPGGIATPRVIEARAARARSRTIDLDRPIPWNEPHLALAADAFQRDPSMAFMYRLLAGLNPPIGDTGTGDMGISPSRLDGYAIPTLMISGSQDRIFPPDILEDVSKVIPGAQLHSIPQAGHSPYFETPEEFNRVVGEFVGKYGG